MCQNGNRDRQSIMNHSHATKGCSHFYSCHARSAPPTSAPLTHPTSPQQAPTCTHKTYECQVQGYLTTACSGRAHEIKQRYRTTKNEQITARCTTHARGASRAMSRLVRALKSSECGFDLIPKVAGAIRATVRSNVLTIGRKIFCRPNKIVLCLLATRDRTLAPARRIRRPRARTTPSRAACTS